jgi:non-homologous end joining protein Ku
MGTKFNRSRPNITVEEAEALKTLITQQRERTIIIKPCDKGAGIIVCNFSDYLKSCQEHLASKINPENPETYYKEIKEKDLDKAKDEIETVLRRALNKGEISKNEFNAMVPREKGPGKFYQIFKVHKKHDPPNLPQGRPIISGCNSATENLSLFVDHHAKH